MELLKKYVRMSQLKEKCSTQMTLDEDFIVPDTKPDIEKVILTQGDVEIEEVKLNGERVQVKGRLSFSVLFQPAAEQQVDSLNGSIPFEEFINVNDWDLKDYISHNWDIEDLAAGMVNSRKLSVKALVNIQLTAERVYDEEVAIEAEDGLPFNSLSRSMDVTQIAVHTKDTYRIRDEIEIENSRPNIAEIIWKKMELRNMECRPMDGALSLRGELLVFYIFRAEEEHVPLQWIEKNLPFSGSMEIADCTEDMIPDISVNLIHKDLEAKPDFDGEMRNVSVEGIIELDIKLFEEDRIHILEDIYSTTREITPQFGEANFQNVLMKNISRTKIAEKMTTSEEEKILQICCCEGSVTIDSTEIVPEGILVEGALCVKVLYLAAEDATPVKSMEGVIPFQHTLEVAGISEDVIYSIKHGVEQLQAVMAGGSQVEIKAVISLDLLALKKIQVPAIIEVSEQPWNMDVIENMPSVVGYIVQPGDTLWKIAKEFHTTIEDIKEINELTTDELNVGDKILLIKQVDELL